MSLADDHLNAVTGKSFDYRGIFLPPGYLWENGNAVSRTTYERLFKTITLRTTGNTTSGNATITSVPFNLTTLDCNPTGWPVSGPGIQAGTTIASFTSNSITLSLAPNATANGVALVLAPYGVGDGSTTFNVPDSRGRVSAGRDNMGGSAASRLTTAGSGINGSQLGHAAGAETHTLTTAQMPTHNHGVTHNAAATFSNGSSGTGGSAIFYLQQAASISTQNNGSGAAHPNAQPTLVCNKIIKT